MVGWAGDLSSWERKETKRNRANSQLQIGSTCFLAVVLAWSTFSVEKCSFQLLQHLVHGNPWFHSSILTPTTSLKFGRERIEDQPVKRSQLGSTCAQDPFRTFVMPTPVTTHCTRNEGGTDTSSTAAPDEKTCGGLSAVRPNITPGRGHCSLLAVMLFACSPRGPSFFPRCRFFSCV